MSARRLVGTPVRLHGRAGGPIAPKLPSRGSTVISWRALTAVPVGRTGSGTRVGIEALRTKARLAARDPRGTALIVRAKRDPMAVQRRLAAGCREHGIRGLH